ncbi:MAG TPA: hypothetical protein VGM82_24060 [Gemmatimonadaceae bacterium]|jgi:hypothetical protein
MIALRHAAVLTAAVTLFASGVGAQSAPPIRPLGAVLATSSDSIGVVRSIRPLSDGRVIVNDPAGQRLLLLDASLEHVTHIADTTAATSRLYGRGLLALMRFAGDSSIVLDQITKAYLVIDPAGKVTRVISPPGGSNPLLALRFGDRQLGTPDGYDGAGHLLFVAQSPYFLGMLPKGYIGDTLMVGPDSTAILRQRIGVLGTDTIVSLKAPRLRQAVTKRANGGNGHSAFNPMPAGDDWTLLSDGTLAVIRVSDYHVDWITPDRRITSGPKVPTQWVKLTESQKVAIMDSVRSARLAEISHAASGPSAAAPSYVTPSDLPDYRPPFVAGFARADADNHVWVRENENPMMGAVYDVIDRDGHLIDRVKLAAGSNLVGFGPGVAYLTSVAQGIVHLTRVALR